MAFENISENTWTPSGDYGTEFKVELQSYKTKITNEIINLQKSKTKIENHVSNSKLHEKTLDAIDICIKRLQALFDEIDDVINSLEYL